MHTYWQGDPDGENPGLNVWYVDGKGNWWKLSGPFPDVAAAAAYVSYLNGGAVATAA
jgi:hypothetical protein